MKCIIHNFSARLDFSHNSASSFSITQNSSGSVLKIVPVFLFQQFSGIPISIFIKTYFVRENHYCRNIKPVPSLRIFPFFIICWMGWCMVYSIFGGFKIDSNFAYKNLPFAKHLCYYIGIYKTRTCRWNNRSRISSKCAIKILQNVLLTLNFKSES